MSNQDECGAKVALNELLGVKPDECTCSAKDMTFGRCCKLKERDKAYALLLRVYSEHCGVSDGRFDSVHEDRIEQSAFPGFCEFVAGFRLGIAEAIKAIEESQPPETTPWDCVDAVRRKLTPNTGLSGLGPPKMNDSVQNNTRPTSPLEHLVRRLARGRASLSAGNRRWIELTWPTIRFRPSGFQFLADSALRIDPRGRAYGISLLGFGVATIVVKTPNAAVSGRDAEDQQ